ncbi:hypothetical protein, unlikely [Trypanosoma brucei gambiense DAL972]|uniref:Uncharacterized protein n=1 Tax=Trypanosoma brucei gambiense (strain MHOM/CI/86/DAL972) TaxID=679716 RepID=D0A0J9_TRYB9|nr:hypothetical protein, unlikely [Trypanosoma brucei gambiense DAL972]CBH16757.1 hypothetical protein, unlikely [Trypanosoma brucei gambiense DAL972]|eukprot:XP_011779021.1 hypothetical protein, unlikely [Trypanosoma brucei gambiense DAL972]
MFVFTFVHAYGTTSTAHQILIIYRPVIRKKSQRTVVVRRALCSKRSQTNHSDGATVYHPFQRLGSPPNSSASQMSFRAHTHAITLYVKAKTHNWKKRGTKRNKPGEGDLPSTISRGR